jgi:formylglycine-generating enzyme required for sulfatase activity
LRDARYPWGDAEPTARLADFDRFESFKLRPVREFAPNGYGLFAMAGTCREWCLDLYDAREYERSAERNPLAQPAASSQRVARGGSWADCAEAITVTFRSAVRSGRYFNDPTFGMRPVRVVTS